MGESSRFLWSALGGMFAGRGKRARRLVRLPLRRLVIESLESRALLTASVGVSYEFDNLAGTPLTSLAAGQDFILKASIQDVQSTPSGIYQAYLTVGFDPTLVTIPTGAAITEGASYAGSPVLSSLSAGSISAGGVKTVTQPPIPANSEFTLFQVELQAQNSGQLSLATSVAAAPDYTLLFGNPVPVPTANLQVTGNSIQIVSSSPASTTTTLSSSVNPSAFGQATTFTATVVPNSGTFDNGGTVQFAVDGTNFGSPVSLSNGQATIQDSALAVGTHTITATYGGDTSFAGSSGTLSGGQVVKQASTTTAVASSLNPSAFGQAATFTATVVPSSGTFDNGGTVQFAVDGTSFGSPVSLSNGQATIQDSALAVGTHTITATYGGDTSFAGSSGTLSGGQVVKQASTTTAVASSLNPSAFGQAATFTATVSPGSGTFDNGGTVQFAVDGTSFGSPVSLSNGQATIQDSALAVGTHTITATYGGDTSFAGSSGTLSGGQVVKQASTTTTLSSSANPSALVKR